MSIDTLVCPENCEFSVAPVKFSECAPKTLLSQINKLYIGNDGYPLTNWTDAAEWYSRISEAGTEPEKIRELTVIGDKPLAEKTPVNISNNRVAYGKSTHTINATIDDNTDENYEWARATECNPTYRLWYATTGGKLYGDNSGIKCSITAGEKLDRDETAFATIEVVVTWKAQFSPIRIDNPLAEA